MKKQTKRKLLVVAGGLALMGAVGATAGTTFAKYTTSGSAGATATVAQWGFTVNANATKLFGEKYYDDGDLVKTEDNTTIVISGAGKVVAPGAKGEMTIQIIGTAEVDAKVSITVAESGFSDVSLTKNGGSVYYPIKWTLTKTGDTASTVFDNGTDHHEGDKVENSKVKAAIEGWESETYYKAGDKITYAAGVEYKIEWEWPFESGHDAEDTALGAYASTGELDTTLYESANETISIPSITIAVEQTMKGTL